MIRALRSQVGQNMHECQELADRIEEFAQGKFPSWKPAIWIPIRHMPECYIHHLPMVYNEDTDEFDCRDPACGHHEYEDEEPRSEGAEVYHQEVADRSRDATHGSSEHRRKREKRQGWRQDEGSPRAKRIPLKEG